MQLLQLALGRAGERLSLDGVFGEETRSALRRFQSKNGLDADGIAAGATNAALLPYYTGFASVRLRRGDTLLTLAEQYGTALSAILTANPEAGRGESGSGAGVAVPLPFDIVPANIDYNSELTDCCVRGLAARYPFIKTGRFGKSVTGRPLRYLVLGQGEKRLLYSAAHHANEWITIPVLLRFAELYAKAYASSGRVFGIPARELFARASIYIIPCVNPDGVDLVTGALPEGEFFHRARGIAEEYPDCPFPSGWKANISGVDLNLQYPAGWEQARANKLALGVSGPAPANYAGPAPLSAPESRAMYDFTLTLAPELVLAYHTQGEVIYRSCLDYEPPRSREIAGAFSALSGYPAEEAPFSSGFAGFKDWFVQEFKRPGYTVEAGHGANPLPISQFDEIFAANLGILACAPLLI